jgi:hypothetical protein
MGAEHLTQLALPLLRPEEVDDFRDEAARICVAMIEAFCVQQDRMQQRLSPLSN